MMINNVRSIFRVFATFSATHIHKIYSNSKLYPVFCQQCMKRSFTRRGKEEESLHELLNDDDFEFNEKSNYGHLNVDIEEIANGNPETIKTLKLYQLEIDLQAQNNGEVPEIITPNQWQKLLLLSSKWERIQFIRSLWIKENIRKNMKEQKNLRLQNYLTFIKPSREERINEKLQTNSPVIYGLADCTLFHRILDPQINNFYNYKLLQAYMNGPHVLIDCGYEMYMNSRQSSFTSRDTLIAWFRNREHFNPLSLIFCNLNPEGELWDLFTKVVPNIQNDPSFPFIHSEKSYLDLYSREQLLYLTPYCDEELKSFDPDTIYILGAIVNEHSVEFLSLAKAKRDGLRMAKLPLGTYVDSLKGSRTLQISQCVDILNDVKDGCSWGYAFRKLPRMKRGLLCDEKDERENKNSPDYLRKRFTMNLIYNSLIEKNKSK